LAAIITAKLESKGISCVLVGGSVVSLYSHEKYVSKDLDFISPATHREIVTAMSELGFSSRGKDFYHPDTNFSVEFPAGPVALGNESPVEAEGAMDVNGTTIRMLSPTQSVMDRLAWFYHFNDRQCLDQALLIAKAHPINFDKLKAWSLREDSKAKYEAFLKLLKP
jgi:hypothetical protein